MSIAVFLIRSFPLKYFLHQLPLLALNKNELWDYCDGRENMTAFFANII